MMTRNTHRRAAALVLWAAALMILHSAAAPVLRAQGQTLVVDADRGLKGSIEGYEVKMLVDPEASYVGLSSGTFLFLYENGRIKDEDIIGSGAMKLSDGSTERVLSVKIHSLEILGRPVGEIVCFVISKQIVPVLVGASALPDMPEVAVRPAYQREAMYQDLRDKAVSHFNKGSYVLAADAFTTLYAEGQLDEVSTYYYICALVFSGQYPEALAVGDEWQAAYPGADPAHRRNAAMLRAFALQETGDTPSAIMWNRRYLEMYGEDPSADDRPTYENVLLRLAVQYYDDDPAESLSYYTEALGMLLEDNGATLDDVSKGTFQDGRTASILYAMALCHNQDKDARNTKKYMVLAARCGSDQAREHCANLRWKY